MSDCGSIKQLEQYKARITEEHQKDIERIDQMIDRLKNAQKDFPAWSFE